MFESPSLIVADVGVLLISFCTVLAPVWHPLGTLLQLLGKLGETPGSFAFQLTHLPTERSTEPQPVRITCTLVHPSYRHVDQKMGRRSSRILNNFPHLNFKVRLQLSLYIPFKFVFWVSFTFRFRRSHFSVFRYKIVTCLSNTDCNLLLTVRTEKSTFRIPRFHCTSCLQLHFTIRFRGVWF